MDPSTLDDIQKRASYWAYNRGYADHAEEFVGYVLLRMVENKSPERMYLSNWFIDFRRNLHGDTRNRTPEGRRYGTKKPPRLHADIEEYKNIGKPLVETLVNLTLSPDECPRCKKEGVRTKALMERAFLILSAKWGFKHDEISEVLGVDPSMVCHIQNGLKSNDEGV